MRNLVTYHQYNHSGSVPPNLPNLPCHQQLLHLYTDAFLTSLGLWHPTLACLSPPQSPKPHANSLSLSLPPCGTGMAYSLLSGAISPYQASILSHLCGCLPHATKALTSSNRPPWANALLTLLALGYALLGCHSYSTLCRYTPTLQGPPHSS